MITIKYYDDDTDEKVEVELPSIKEVCHDCEGNGFVLNESMRYHAYTPEEFYEEFDDEDREEYFRRDGTQGKYDVPCPTCKAKNVIDVVDESKLTPEQKIHFEKYKECEENNARWDAEDRATRRAEDGYRW